MAVLVKARLVVFFIKFSKRTHLLRLEAETIETIKTIETISPVTHF